MKTKIVSTGIIVFIAILIGCTDKDMSKTPPPGDGNAFDYRTANNITANVNYSVPEEYALAFEAYAEDPIEIVNDEPVKKEGLKTLFKGITDNDGNYSELVQIPASIKEVYLYTDALGVPSVTKYSIDGTQVKSKSVSSRAGETDYIYSTRPSELKIVNDGKWNVKGVPNYLGAPKNVSSDGLKMVNSSLGTKSDNVDNYIAENGEANINIVKDGAIIDLVVVHNSGNTVTNTMGYYYYDSQKPPRSVEDIQKIVLFPNATFAPKAGLQLGDNVRLKYWDEATQSWIDQFPKGITIGWFILVGGFNSTSYAISQPDTWKVYAYSNTELNDLQRKHNVIVRDPNTKIRYIGFEDKNFHQADYRDFIFYIEADPSYVEYNDDNIPDGKDLTDSDGDGVPDVDDEFPDDPLLAYTIKYNGTVAFEDIWPYQGDYDMNDVVMEYNTIHYLNARNLIVKVKDVWTLKNNGAQYTNGFAYQYETSSSMIRSMNITSDYTIPTRFNLNSKGLENNQTKATIILFDDAEDVVKTGKDMVFTVETTLGGMKSSELGLPPYNPFIIAEADKQRGREVHLPNHKPTDLMDMSLLHYGHDLSEPAKGLYFISNNYFPFAIHIVGTSFDFPKEGQRIDEAFPQYTRWTTSNGTENLEWYKHKK